MVMLAKGELSDGFIFSGGPLPASVKTFIKHAGKLNDHTYKSMKQAALRHLQGENITNEDWKKVIEKADGLDNEHLVYTGLVTLLTHVFRCFSTKVCKNVQKELHDLRLPDGMADDILETVQNGGKLSCPKLASLEKLDWRVDVTISNNRVSRVLEPSVVLQLTLSDGSIHHMEVSVTKLHLLRHSVASILKDMQEVEGRSIFKGAS